jgi:GTPase SAR1 family protein
MKIKEIIRDNVSFLNYPIEVNGEKYDFYKHGDLIHIDTDVETDEEYNFNLNTTFYRTKIKFTAIEHEKILKLLESEDKDVDTSLSDYMDKRIKEVSEE